MTDTTGKMIEALKASREFVTGMQSNNVGSGPHIISSYHPCQVLLDQIDAALSTTQAGKEGEADSCDTSADVRRHNAKPPSVMAGAEAAAKLADKIEGCSVDIYRFDQGACAIERWVLSNTEVNLILTTLRSQSAMGLSEDEIEKIIRKHVRNYESCGGVSLIGFEDAAHDIASRLRPAMGPSEEK